MTINNNLSATSLTKRGNISVNNEGVASSLKKLSSGLRINSASDDAAGIAISEKLRGTAGGLAQATVNAQNGISAIQTAEGGLGNSADILSRMKELAVQASNGTYSDDDRALLNKEFTELKGSLDQIASSTNYNGINLLDGSLDANGLASAGINLQIGADGSADQRMLINIGDMSSEALGLKDVDISTLSGANGALDALDSAIDTVSVTRGDLGASQNRLESTINNLEAARYNAVSSESTIRDLDMAKEVMESTLEKIRDDSATAVQAQAMNLMRQNATSLLQR